LAGWAALLSRLSGQQDVMIGTPVANRGRVEIENLIGFFVNTLVMRVDVSGGPTVRELLARVKKQSVAAQQHQDIPFEQVVELVQPVRSLAHSPLFQVMFAWQDAIEPELPGLEVLWLGGRPHFSSQFDMSMSLGIAAMHRGCSGVWDGIIQAGYSGALSGILHPAAGRNGGSR
jgi:non-ribosomal peptide synthetase component F